MATAYSNMQNTQLEFERERMEREITIKEKETELLERNFLSEQEFKKNSLQQKLNVDMSDFVLKLMHQSKMTFEEASTQAATIFK